MHNKPDDLAQRHALIVDDRVMTRGALASAARRMARVLLDAQSETPRHAEPDGTFTDQFRLMALLPQGETLMATAIAAHATETLLCSCATDVPPAQVAARTKAFRPHLVIASASAWSAARAADPELGACAVLICDDEGGQAALNELIDSHAPCPPLSEPRAHRPALVVFTSGSTGAPKGIVLPSGLMNGHVGLDRMNVTTNLGPVAYLTRWDAVGLADLMSVLRGGQCIAVPPFKTIQQPGLLWGWLEQTGVRILSAPVTLWRYLVQTVPPTTPVKVGMLWGEALPEPLVKQLWQKAPGLSLCTNFGATECTYMSFGRIRKTEFDDVEGSPAGRVLNNRDIVLIDDVGNPLRGKAAGRVRVTSPAVLIGHLEDLMARNPAIDPQDWPATTVIENVARILPGRRLDVLGRQDGVVKLGGRRLSLAAIEHIAATQDGVLRSLCWPLETDGGTRLVLAVEAVPDAHASLPGKINAQIADDLGDWALPAQIVVAESFPVLSSGKLDRRGVMALGIPPTDDDDAIQEGLPDHLSDPVSRALAAWARARGKASYAPQNELPALSSIDFMELHLLAEEILGRQISEALPLGAARTWGDLETLFREKSA